MLTDRANLMKKRGQGIHPQQEQEQEQERYDRMRLDM